MIESFVALLFLLVIGSAIPVGIGLWLKKRYLKTKFILLAIAALFILTQTSFWLYDFSGMQADSHYNQLKAFLNQPFTGLSQVGLSRGKAIIALSYMTEGLVSYAIQKPDKTQEIIPLLEKVLEIAFHPSVSPYQDINKFFSWGEEGLYLSHLNVILGSYQRLANNRKYLALTKQISAHLANKILSEPAKNIRSYHTLPDKWPADNAVSLYSLYLFDKNNKAQISQKPITEWLQYMKTNGTEPQTKLHYSEVTGSEVYSKYPRGCALSWTAKYMGDFAPKEAKQLWNNYKKQFKKTFLITAGFREYPPNVNLGENNDSGPIILGIGAGATGLALNGSKSVGDYLTYYQLNNIVITADILATLMSSLGSKSWEILSQDLLATSIRFNAETKVPWY